ncbi:MULTISPECIES: ArsI/CadI family heavy metal resistance metalloenzyme [Okeania]|uniref:Glyoxalase/bleomycin resistance/dioxygenase family protein n=1 Tax=Okeania hirsuta TaxID=1458930 RepID=A0A3N6R1D1_9CYAN|nr:MULTISPECIES: ArsI/CadI family heavy metal resistance metalloenzyme [Okeania]NET11588.1 glyoxalase/bleomycin resistance/dioxygenase family protein [Okeania sp. SIO1H6]NEP70744.1 glyoxalase/bleomycin resistance/dioxygenase family protein [Okeania sp. SIO2G5]NEP95796.1 glyoxalase/bleomycin resistance/dioxygenase family protein [Okeania sp. SIO2F5]NEQ89824.1 glyoxalase/bleomycin resistance/dioxygenase family protein [Okeania sp. SIO2G4]NES79950.1 glyoxalase/bleomycin resistance/dioxygenase fam
MSTLKTHIALIATNLEKSVEFYQALFGVAPVKYKSDYAKFDIANPPLNLTLNLEENVEPGGNLSHLGIQVSTSEEVATAIERFKVAGLSLFEEHQTDCCYALQDKVWVTDPDGNRWEVFVVKVADTAPEKNIVATSGQTQ